MLDPGHGGTDPGATNTEYDTTRSTEPPQIEAELVLQIANHARDVLTGAAAVDPKLSAVYRVCLTRIDETTNPTNTQRAEYANSVGGNALVLVHLNGSTDPALNYMKTFWGKKTKDLRFSEALNRSLKADPTVMNPDTSPFDVTDGGVGQFASGALLKSNMPATLAELVFVTSDAEALRFESQVPDREQQLGTALGKAIDSWFQANP